MKDVSEVVKESEVNVNGFDVLKYLTADNVVDYCANMCITYMYSNFCQNRLASAPPPLFFCYIKEFQPENTALTQPWMLEVLIIITSELLSNSTLVRQEKKKREKGFRHSLAKQ